MRGSPLFRVILVVIALLALLVPLRILTGRSTTGGALATPVVQKAAAKKRVHMELTSTTVPFKYQISNAGETICSGESGSATVAKDAEFKFPPEGVDLVIDASWAGEKETAVRLALTPKDSDTMAKTVWGTTAVSEVLTFKEEK